MRPEGEGSAKCLTGVLRYDLAEGTILVLRKISDTEYHLNAIDKRHVNTSRETLASFHVFEDQRPHVQKMLGVSDETLSSPDGTGKT